MKEDKKLYRSDNRIIGGVCAGIAQYFGLSKNLFRLLYLVFSVLSAAFPGTLVYIVLWIIMPKRR